MPCSKNLGSSCRLPQSGFRVKRLLLKFFSLNLFSFNIINLLILPIGFLYILQDKFLFGQIYTWQHAVCEGSVLTVHVQTKCMNAYMTQIVLGKDM